MSEASRPLRIERIDASSVRLSGEIAFANAGDAVARTSEIFSGNGDIAIDLGGLSRADSATLGVLLIWAATAAVRGVRLRFTNAPAGLKALAHLCDTEPLLGLA
ncbi:MAG TPA: STAS domain-containing protein [Rhodanobacteraceae bacterium]|nr:STAS domain-containing protein [Rhodanobacteraceae bacterium]